MFSSINVCLFNVSFLYHTAEYVL